MIDSRQLAQGSSIKGRIFGVDEAGRGALAGPLAVAAVEFPWPWAEPSVDTLRFAVRDSKTLSVAMRSALALNIVNQCNYACAMIPPDWIDKYGIQQAETEGLISAIRQLATRPADVVSEPDWPEVIVCDGTPDTWGVRELYISGIASRLRFMVKGDAHVPAISAASIVAKVVRDEYMREEAHRLYPQYDFSYHVGYGTPRHLAALKKFGPSPIHRFSFKPVRECNA